MMNSGLARERVEYGRQTAITSNMRKLHSGFIPLRAAAQEEARLCILHALLKVLALKCKLSSQPPHFVIRQSRANPSLMFVSSEQD